jgi:hypothetical protein
LSSSRHTNLKTCFYKNCVALSTVLSDTRVNSASFSCFNQQAPAT